MAKKGESFATAEASKADKKTSANPASAIILFATKTCPNCKIAKTYLDKAGVPYSTVYADENIAETEKYGVRQAPTLVLNQGDTFEKVINLSNIKKFAEEYNA